MYLRIGFSAGENAVFDVQISEPAANSQWLKDNKPLDDKLADRINIQEYGDNHYRLELKHCR